MYFSSFLKYSFKVSYIIAIVFLPALKALYIGFFFSLSIKSFLPAIIAPCVDDKILSVLKHSKSTPSSMESTIFLIFENPYSSFKVFVNNPLPKSSTRNISFSLHNLASSILGTSDEKPEIS